MQIEEDPSIKRVAWVVENLTTSGIGTVCRYVAEGVARLSGWRATVVSLRPPPSDQTDPLTKLRHVSLGLKQHAPQAFLRWLGENPQQIVITNDVPQIESAFQHFPKETLHIVGIHDSSRRFVEVALRNHRWVDGVFGVAHHLEELLRNRLNKVHYHGLVGTVHNGAAFPPLPARDVHSGLFRLLFIGGVVPFKGIFDLVPILERLTKMGVPAHLTIAGGKHDLLERQFKRKHLDHLVAWTGWVAHEECYRLAAENDVLLMASRKEAFGMVTLEAMAMGCVPLAYDIVSGSRDIIENGQSGLLLPLGNFRVWARAIQSLHQDREQLRRLSQGAMDRARTHFNEVTMTSQLCEFLKRVQAHAQIHPSERKPGLPPEIMSPPRTLASYYHHYQSVPPAFRQWIQNRIGASPRLCYWLLRRW